MVLIFFAAILFLSLKSVSGLNFNSRGITNAVMHSRGSSLRKFPIYLITKSSSKTKIQDRNKDSEDEILVDSESKGRVRVEVQGDHCTNALFRAEVMKELTFFRGCNAYYAEMGTTAAVILAEGRITQLNRFLSWLKGFGTQLTERKPSFQGPSLIIHIADIDWEPYKGDMKGFTTSNDAPELMSIVGSLRRARRVEQSITGFKEASSMAGTDESV